jgi:glycosyltransferase involved in cell wall biosynthesis
MSKAAAPSETQQVNQTWMSIDYEPGLVSIIIPTYNRAHLITNALESVRRQTYRRIEVLVVDDGSDDETDAVVSGWIDRNAGDGIHASYSRQPNRGAPAARNEGLRRSRGEFIQFLDSDDVLLPRKLELQVGALKSSPFCPYAWSDRERASLESVWNVYADLARSSSTMSPGHAGEQVAGYAKTRMPNQGGQGLYRRSVCVDLGPWDEGLARHQDWEFNLRLVSSKAVVLYVRGVQYISVNHSGPRVFGTNNDTSKNYQLFVAASQVAERRLTDQSSGTQAARYKIAILYLSAALAALERGERDRFDAAMDGFRRNRIGKAMKLKGALLSSGLSLFGVGFARGFSRVYRRLKLL